MNIDRVKELIEQGCETEILDFKEQFHENKADLLHDILCLANNTQFQDAYLVFGINDRGETIGIENQQKRIKLADIQGFLHDNRSKFFNNELPEVDVVVMHDSGHEIDVLEVKSSFKVPYFLIEQYSVGKKKLRSGHIYSRTGDRNTPIDEYASPNQIDKLWKKRYFLLEKPMDYLLHLLDFPEKWIKENDEEFHSDSYYYESNPEYKIVETHEIYEPNKTDYLSFAQADTTTLFGKYECIDKNTRLKSGGLIILDGGRTTITIPSIKSFGPNLRATFLVDYYIDNSIEYKLLKLFNPEQNEWDNVGLHKFFGHTLVFASVAERDQFFMFIEENVPAYHQKIQVYVCDNYFDSEASQYDKERLSTGFILKKELENFPDSH